MPNSEKIQPLDPSVRLSNSYFELPSEHRKDMLAGLMLAARYAPTASEFYKARQESDVTPFENRYGDLADVYAMSIDKNFQPRGVLDNDPETVEKRATYYKMIRHLTAEQIDKGVKAILHRGQESTSPQK